LRAAAAERSGDDGEAQQARPFALQQQHVAAGAWLMAQAATRALAKRLHVVRVARRWLVARGLGATRLTSLARLIDDAVAERTVDAVTMVASGKDIESVDTLLAYADMPLAASATSLDARADEPRDTVNTTDDQDDDNDNDNDDDEAGVSPSKKSRRRSNVSANDSYLRRDKKEAAAREAKRLRKLKLAELRRKRLGHDAAAAADHDERRASSPPPPTSPLAAKQPTGIYDCFLFIYVDPIIIDSFSSRCCS
jgi:hypothetical protein